MLPETSSSKKAPLDELKKALPSNEPRYCVYVSTLATFDPADILSHAVLLLQDWEYTTSDGRLADKLLLIDWQPESSRPHLRTFYSSQKSKCTAMFTGVEELFARRLHDIEVALGVKKDESDSDAESDWDPDA